MANLSGDAPTMTRVTNNAANDADPAWSHDGNRLAFASDRDGDWDVYITDTNLANPTNLTDSTSDDAGGHDDRWPDVGFYNYGDGTGDYLVAFASNRDGDWEIFTMYDDGSDQTQSTSNMDSAADSQPSWDPLAEYLVIHSNRGGDFEIASMYYDGSGYGEISSVGDSNSSDSTELSPDWEPVDDGVYCGE